MSTIYYGTINPKEDKEYYAKGLEILQYWNNNKLTGGLLEIKNVIFNDPATIVFWDDGTKTVVKCQPGDSFDSEKGLAMAITKKAYGNKGSYCNKLKKWLPKEEPVDTNSNLRSIFVPKEFTFTADILTGGLLEIKNVIFNDPATIVFWDDGTKTVVKCQPGDSFDSEKGLAMAITKKAYGNKGSYCNKLKKWLPKEEPVDTNSNLRSIFVPKEFTFTADIDKLSKSFIKGIKDGIDSIFNGTRCTPDDNSVSSKKRMTFREEEAKLHPEHISACWMGGVFGCPRDKEGNCTVSATDKTCRACWDRVIPDELMDND